MSEYTFRKAKHGDDKALVILLSAEQSLLFDYIFRMTANPDLASGSLKEIVGAVTSQISDYRDFEHLRVSLFSTARRFNFESWNADTKHLIKESDPEKSFDSEFYRLSGEIRETALLYYRLDFSINEMMEIMGVSRQRIEENIEKSKLLLEEISSHEETPNSLGEAMGSLPFIPNPNGEEEGTMAISQVVADIRKPNIFGLGKRLFFILLLLALLAIALYFNLDKLNLPQ